MVLLATIIVAGAGYYLTEVYQVQQMEEIEAQDREVRLRNARAEELLQIEAQNESVAEGTLMKWRSRYKVIPETISTPDIVQYLERLTSRGFKEIAIDRVAQGGTAEIQYHSFRLNGSAYFRSLVDLVWQLENNRDFYRVRDLQLSHEVVSEENPETGRQRSIDMVGFTLEVDVYYSANEGLTPSTEELAEIPRSLLPIRTPAHDSFHPIIRTDLPPNDRNLVDVETAVLVSIVGGQAIFEDSEGQRALSEGDEVYLGSIVKIDPIRAFVRASLNKGGVIDVVEIPLSAGEQLRLPGDIRRAPIRGGTESGGR
jgi:hypothetical protein